MLFPLVSFACSFSLSLFYINFHASLFVSVWLWFVEFMMVIIVPINRHTSNTQTTNSFWKKNCSSYEAAHGTSFFSFLFQITNQPTKDKTPKPRRNKHNNNKNHFLILFSIVCYFFFTSITPQSLIVFVCVCVFERPNSIRSIYYSSLVLIKRLERFFSVFLFVCLFHSRWWWKVNYFFTPLIFSNFYISIIIIITFYIFVAACL